MTSRTERIALAIAIAIALIAPLAAQKPTDVRLDTGHPADTFQTGNAKLQAVGSAVYATYDDLRNGTSDVFFNRSTDGGATWLASEVRVSTGAVPGATNAWANQLAVDGSLVCVAWTDDRNGGTDVYLNRSTDGGVTWLANPVLINTGGTPGVTTAYNQHLVVSGTDIWIVWNDNRNGNDQVFFNRSTDAGTTWLPTAIRIDHAGSGDITSDPAISVFGNLVHVAWTDYYVTGFSDIVANSSLDGGVTWQATDRILNASRSGQDNPFGVQMDSFGSFVTAVWQDNRLNANDYDVFFSASTDGGITWSGETRLSVGRTAGASTINGSFYPCIVLDAATVCVAYCDDRTTLFYPEVYFTRSIDLGQTWSTEVRLDIGRAAGASQSWFPVMASEGSHLTVVWQDDRGSGGMQDLYGAHSTDGGLTFAPFDVHLNTGGVPGYNNVGQPAVAMSGGSVYVAWDENRNYGTVSDIYFNLASGSQRYGSGTAGTAGRVPALTASGAAVFGGAFRLAFGNGLAGTLGGLVLGVNGAQIAQPLLGGTLLVQPTTTTFFLLNGTGATSINVAVPASVQFLGFDLEAQGLFVDAGAPQGVSMSNALTIWIG